MTTMDEVKDLSDDALLRQVKGALVQSRGLLADVLALLSEVDARRLYLNRAHPSLFAYCVAELGFSEDEAYARILVARACRRVPGVLEAVREGRIHLTAARLLAPHLTEANCEALLGEAAGRSRREVEEIVARLAPQPPVPDSIRKLPVRQPASAGDERGALFIATASCEEPVAPSAVAGASAAVSASPGAPTALRPPQPAFVPLAQDNFKVQFTAPRSLRDKLRKAQALLGADDVASVMEKALDLLLVDVKKRRFALVPTPRKTPLQTMRGAGRHVPAAIRRAVFLRDEGRCTFHDDRGHRCNETRHLEFDHIKGFARMRVHSVEGVRLLCSAHNLLEAERVYGPEFIAAASGARVKAQTLERPGRRTTREKQLGSELVSPSSLQRGLEALETRLMNDPSDRFQSRAGPT
ncbi:MAG: hypothetical protein ACKVPX_09310 [Myxococcaceae bacterium]